LTEETVITVPEHVLRAALAAFESRDPAARVAALVRDSQDLPRPPAIRQLHFTSDDLEVDLRVIEHGDRLTVCVDIDPRHECGVELKHPGGSIRTDVQAGHCEIPGVEHGLVRVTLEGPAGRGPRRTQTTWVTL
jgi:hypothetical protein